MEKGKRYLYIILVMISIIIASRYYLSNSVILEEGLFYSTDEKELKEGKLLSVQYCSGCHLYPEPNLLPKNIWTSSILPAMGPKMGIFRHEIRPYPTERDPYLPENYYPAEAHLSSDKWQKIINYYSDAAPETLTPTIRDPKIIVDTLFFEASAPKYNPVFPPKVTAIRMDTTNGLIYTGDVNEKRLLVFNRELDLENKFSVGFPISDIRLKNDANCSENTELLITFMGQLLPTDEPSGSVKNISYNPVKNEIDSNFVIWENISRPVESKLMDLNQNGLDDILISEFGHRSGSLFWLENKGDGYDDNQNILINTPGCIETKVVDFNGNNLKDIIALCTQVDQAIYLFINKGDGIFQRETLLRFHIAAGSSSFELHDFNSNGHLDILYTSGDNADYSTIHKPYHGVYIFLNDGNNNFNEEWFYPINGAYNAKARDYNRNGELDIAVIAFYGDFENKPEEGFIFFKNEGDLSFTPYHHPEATTGRWITMDVADWTGNGYEDILLGNFSDGFFSVSDSIQNRWKHSPHFLLLKNKQGE